MKIMYNKLMLITICLTLSLHIFGQVDSILIMGCWEQLDPISIENVDDEIVVNRLVYRGQRSKVIMLCDNEGLRINPDGAESHFLWNVEDGKVCIKEDLECPFVEYLYPRFIHSDVCDTLYLEKHFKNPSYKTADIWIRRKINIMESPKPINVLTKKEDYYESYRRRIIKKQKPSIWKGHLDKKGNLFVDSMVYGCVLKMTKSNQIECHVIDNPIGKVRNYKIFIVTYDIESKEIINISFVNEYNR